MRSPFAYVPARGPLQTASPLAAIAYLGALVAVAFLFSNPLVLLAVGGAAALAGELAGAHRAVRAALRLGLVLALLIAVVNGLVVDRGETVLLRFGELPVLGRTDVTAEALAAGAVIGLRAAVAILAFSVYSACVDPDRVLRVLRPLAGRSALTATLISRLVPVAAADASRLRDAGGLRGPGAAPLGRAALARRLLAGSLDRAVDVAATLELRGYSLPGPRRRAPGAGSSGAVSPGAGPRRSRLGRFDGRFLLAAAGLLAATVAGLVLGAAGFEAYPTVTIEAGPPTLALCAAILLTGLVPWRPRSRRPAPPARGGGRGSVA